MIRQSSTKECGQSGTKLTPSRSFSQGLIIRENAPHKQPTHISTSLSIPLLRFPLPESQPHRLPTTLPLHPPILSLHPPILSLRDFSTHLTSPILIPPRRLIPLLLQNPRTIIIPVLFRERVGRAALVTRTGGGGGYDGCYGGGDDDSLDFGAVRV